ncbi:RlpA-like double-psi beta-barrel-protein domain-containing protein-containing protein [Armillaria novae-zelandiae]|uniref:RlpA-like double-psi beta-barrel-protein domain-containing protein-containing protein n=1 Tax=Armillaria novae-zelandiae TaxID=153914 RepID=A0AA39P3K7_9AGAR|nr:RlpA-like double-psi beta-barrel-protein domain-containing protein-containing protein [Armillaria novae-zelandiae]
MFTGALILLLTLTSFVTATISLPHGERPLHRRRGWARRTLEERQAGSHGHGDHASDPASGGFSSQVLAAAQKTTTTQATSTTTSSESSSTGSSSSIVAATSSSPNTGEITYYSTGLGSCGVTSSDTDRIVALSQDLYDLYTTNGNSNDNSLCGKTIHIEYGSSSTDVTVVDRCTGCSSTDLDLSPTAFTDLASEDEGRLYGASWYFTS